MAIGLSYTSGSKLSSNKTFMGIIAALDNCDLLKTTTYPSDF